MTSTASNLTRKVFAMHSEVRLSDRMKAFLEVLSQEGLENAAQGLSTFVGKKLTLASPKVELVPLVEIPNVMGGPETIVVGIYLAIEGDLTGHIMFLLPRENALELVDLLMEQPVGTTQKLDPLARSALAEVGNLAGSLFLNSVSSLTGIGARPSPPAVMEDMLGAILDVVAVAVGGVSEYVLMIETVFQKSDREVEALLWVIPDLETLANSLG